MFYDGCVVSHGWVARGAEATPEAGGFPEQLQLCLSCSYASQSRAVRDQESGPQAVSCSCFALGPRP